MLCSHAKQSCYAFTLAVMLCSHAMQACTESCYAAALLSHMSLLYITECRQPLLVYPAYAIPAVTTVVTSYAH